MTIFVIVSNKFTGSYSSYLLESAGKVDSPADKRWKIWDHDIKGGQRREGKFQIVKNTGKNICRQSLSKNIGPLYRMSQLMFCWHSLCEKKRIWDIKGFISTDWTKVVGAVAGSQREEYKCQIVYKTRSSWLNCALRDDEAVYWVSIRYYEAVAVGNWWYLVWRGHLCLYILRKVELCSGVTDALLTHWLPDNFNW